MPFKFFVSAKLRFPKNAKTLKKWRTILCVRNLVSRNLRICEKHYTPDSFQDLRSDSRSFNLRKF